MPCHPTSFPSINTLNRCQPLLAWFRWNETRDVDFGAFDIEPRVDLSCYSFPSLEAVLHDQAYCYEELSSDALQLRRRDGLVSLQIKGNPAGTDLVFPAENCKDTY